MTTMSQEQKLLNVLEDTAELLKKTQINLKKCPKQRLTRGYIQSRIQCIEEHWKTFSSTHQELAKITPREKRNLVPYFLNEEFYVYEDLYICLLGELRDMALTLSKQSSATSMENASEDVPQQTLVKLPRITIPKFSGNYDEWPPFKDLFVSLVHDNKTLSKVQKMHYLKDNISGEAAALIKHMHITEGNYIKAWDTLRIRYNNKRSIVHALLKRLFAQKKSHTQSASHLKCLLDTTVEILNSLQNLELNTDSWDPIIVFLVVQKLDPETHKDWEKHAYKGESEELATWEELKTFLTGSFRSLERSTPSSSNNSREKPKEKAFHVSTSEISCAICKQNHTLSHCKSFAAMKPLERSDYVKNNKLCYNCLASGHSIMKCRVPMSCKICKRRHHTLIHQPRTTDMAASSSNATQPTISTQADVEEEVQVNTMIYYNARQEMGLLATAMVTVQSDQGHTVVLKALIDPGSQACFISEKAAQFLKLHRKSTNKIVTGMESIRVVVKHQVHVEILSRWESNASFSTTAYVMSKHLTTQIPTITRSINHWPHLQNLELADPQYYISSNIDLLLDVKAYAKILQQGLVKGPAGSPIAQRTNLGWIVFGEMSIKTNTKNQCLTTMSSDEQFNMDELLKTMWELDTDIKRKLTNQERICEEYYEKTHTRDKTGRYIVKLPFNTDTPKSTEGKTRDIALNRFLQLEKRFNKHPKIRKEYVKVMEEYKNLKHLEKVPQNEQNMKSVYLPHHAVFRNDKETTKTRVVFDASCKGSNGISLNDELLIGPILQDDLRSLITRWRTHAICFVSDIQKMYRMVLIAKEDTDYQRILWRSDPSENIEDYRLLTVTFGTASAPYLAVKTLMQLACDEGHKYPEAATILKEDLYIDDIMSGCDSLHDAIRITNNLKELLRQGGFELQKWCSNNADLMKSINPNERSIHAHLDLNIDGTIKALGVQWNMGSDQFEYNLNLSSLGDIITKRSILSDLQKLFDPLGWIAPCIVQAKILVQKLWQVKLDWDENLKSPYKEEWINIRTDLINVNEIRINRWLGTQNARKHCIQIHGFSDASIKAYAAVVYCRVHNEDDTVTTSLIAARTRVAPIKTVSLPRLELCGALLLSRLLHHIATAMRIPMSRVYAWTDSSIVIAWLQGEPNRWKTFVANRIVEITSLLANKQWYYVRSEENPADVASRGSLVSELKTCGLWWKGPEWLTNKDINFVKPQVTPTCLEQKTKIQNLLMNKVEQEQSITEQFENFNSLKELIRSITICRRFLKHKQLKFDIDTIFTTEELDESLNICIRKVQGEDFAEEIRYLKNRKPVKRNSPLKSLDPFIDENQILRVGGRLRHSELQETSKHPIILSNKNTLTPLIIKDAHSKTLHGGMQLMLCYIRTKYWIIRVKSLVRKFVHKCLICCKQNATARSQVMGDLPKVRVTPARPFLHSGVDFAGPIHVLQNKGRGGKSCKAYISIFICMATRAIHLELVGDLTSEAFISAFKRFCARRGRCAHLWSDQGRNFVGANKELTALWKEACLEFSGETADLLASDGTQRHFIPAYSQNFGGLWEAGVKSVKYHLKRIFTNNLTYEEMTTVLCEIEACLNSRPLCPRDDMDDEKIEPLTPGHFLIGEMPIAIPSPSLENVKVSTLSRWQHTRKLLSDFWSRWQQEYLSRLQQRPKWLKREKDFEIGDIVLIKQDHMPPGKWLLGRILEGHPGSDGHTRVYSVKSGDSIVKRTVTKLCPLPIDKD